MPRSSVRIAGSRACRREQVERLRQAAQDVNEKAVLNLKRVEGGGSRRTPAARGAEAAARVVVRADLLRGRAHRTWD